MEVEECVEQDGILRTRRGFVCPPTMPVFDVDELAERHLPGTYVTRLFHPPISFTLPGPTWSRGERLGFVEIDFLDRGPRAVAERGLRIYGEEIAREVIPTGEQREDEWSVTETLLRTSVDIWGYEARQIDFQLGEACRSGCNMTVQGTRQSQFTWDHTHHVRLLVVPLPDGSLAIEVFTPDSEFDTYWTEVAQPILESIEFLDQ